ncbi:MAG: ACP S-malonyltransferase [Planctomycetes bacterium]|nr:ACP S-malonyltransferase [Planctomycetota bacterium]
MSKKAILMPGQGAQFVGMGKDLAENFKSAREIFERANEKLGIDLAKFCFEGPEDGLKRTDVQQPAILTHSIAAFEAMKEVKGEEFAAAEATCGLSLGEYSALIVAGAMNFEDGVYLVSKRGEFMQKACDEYPSGLVSVLKLLRDEVSEICTKAAAETGEHCVLGNILGEKNITVSGGLKALEVVVNLAKEKRARAMLLKVAGAFHSPYMESARAALAEEIEKTTFNPPAITVISNVTGKPASDVAEIKGNLVKQLSCPVLWSDSMKHLVSEGFNDFWEFGPGQVLTGLLKREGIEATYTNITLATHLQ